MILNEIERAVICGKQEYRTNADFIDAIEAAVIAKLARLAEKQEPVAWAMQRADGLVLDVICPEEHESHEGSYTLPLYAAAGASPQPSQAGETCEWTLEDDESGTWASSCGELWGFIDGGPGENRVTYCHHCGKRAAINAKGAV